VWIRTRIEQLLDHAGHHGFDVQHAARRVSELDTVLRGVFEPGEYIGSPGSEDLYPKARYWWLYGVAG
jgi:hypothetical protein